MTSQGKCWSIFTAWPDWASDEKLTTSIYKVDTRGGIRQETEQTRETAYFNFDASGRARLRTTHDGNDNPVLMYRPGSSDDWQPVPKSLAGYSMDLLRVETDGNTAYATITDTGEPTQLYKVDLAKGSRVRLAGRDDLSVSSVLYGGRGGAPFGVIYEGAKPAV